jgi:hypothetical protein
MISTEPHIGKLRKTAQYSLPMDGAHRNNASAEHLRAASPIRSTLAHHISNLRIPRLRAHLEMGFGSIRARGKKMIIPGDFLR